MNLEMFVVKLTGAKIGFTTQNICRQDKKSMESLLKRDVLEIELVKGKILSCSVILCAKIPQTNLQIPCLSLKYHCAAFQFELSVS